MDKKLCALICDSVTLNVVVAQLKTLKNKNPKLEEAISTLQSEQKRIQEELVKQQGANQAF